MYKQNKIVILLHLAIFLCIITISFNIYQYTRDNHIIQKKGKSLYMSYPTTREELYIEQYYKCIEFIMFHENYEKYQYRCPANKLTIGFGHAVRNGEKFKQPMSHKSAYLLLKSDFDIRIDAAKKLGFVKNNSRQLAVAHAIYCMGPGKVKKIISDGFANHIRNYTGYYDKNGVLVKKEVSSSRVFEYNLWMKKY